MGALKKKIQVLVRAPLFWVVVWSCHLFFIQKNNKNKYKLHDQNISNVID